MKLIKPIWLNVCLLGLICTSNAFSQALAPINPATASTAAELWVMHMNELQRPTGQFPNREAAAADLEQRVSRLSLIDSEIIKRFPSDPLRWNAELSMLKSAAALRGAKGDRSFPPDVEAKLRAITASFNATTDVKRDAGLMLLEVMVRNATPAKIPDVANQIEREFKANATAQYLQTVLKFAADKDQQDNTNIIELLTRSSDLNLSAAAKKINTTLVVDKVRRSADDDLTGAMTKAKQLLTSPDADVSKAATALVTSLEERNLIMSRPLSLKFTAIDGRPVDLEAMRRKVVVLFFFASTSKASLAVIPYVGRCVNDYRGKDVEFVGVSLDKDIESLKSLMSVHGITYPIYFDGREWDNGVASRLFVRSVPQVWVIKKGGMIAGKTDPKDLSRQIDRYLSLM